MAEDTKQRPVYRNIHVTQIVGYALPAAGLVSILHRVSGALMFLLLPLVIWMFDTSVTTEISYDRFTSVFRAGAGIVPGWFFKLVCLGLIWAYLQASASSWATAFFGLYIIATTVLFGGVYWSKFAHMFFKPAAAFEKRVSRANGTSANLPMQTRDDPAQRERHSMELLRDAPMDMGLGIKREAPRHY